MEVQPCISSPAWTLQFDQNTSIVAEDGGVIAKGTRDDPIVLHGFGLITGSGFLYQCPLDFRRKQKSTVLCLLHCEVCLYGLRYLVWCARKYPSAILRKMPRAVFIAGTVQNPGCSTIRLPGNRGEGAVTSVGLSNPAIHYNNFMDNEVAIQTRSTIYIDGPEQLVGKKARRDGGMIFGDLERNININPWLKSPEGKKAFSGKEIRVQEQSLFSLKARGHFAILPANKQMHVP